MFRPYINLNGFRNYLNLTVTDLAFWVYSSLSSLDNHPRPISAGQIYNYLNAKGEVSINKMKKDLSLSENFAEMGLGWLSREDKLEYTQKAKSVTVRLR